MKVHIGCSGFYYKDWKGIFYPEGLSQEKWLPYYAEHFDTVEINNTFYSMPKSLTCERWYDRVGPDFLFTIKGNRAITHYSSLVKVEEDLNKFYEAITPLKEKLGTVLWQLPPSVRFDPDLLASFCQLLTREFPNVIEFRHASWFNEETMDTMTRHGVSFCMVSSPWPLPEGAYVTAETAYLRFHGKQKGAPYRYDYSDEELEEWAFKLHNLDVQDLYIYFNNDYDANAIRNGRKLRELLGNAEL